MEIYDGYRPPLWVDQVLKLIQSAGTKVAYIKMAATGNLNDLSEIFLKYALTFWSQVIEEFIQVKSVRNKNGTRCMDRWGIWEQAGCKRESLVTMSDQNPKEIPTWTLSRLIGQNSLDI